MCRWFAYISSTEPCLLEDVLITPAHSLSKQVHQHYLPKLLSHDPSTHAQITTKAEIATRNRLFNVDGFGMSWYTPSFSSFSDNSNSLHPALYKTIQPPLHDTNFRSICANTASKVVFAHIRAATATAITPTNNHPFTFGIHTIMHNGYISTFQKIKLQMCQKMSQDAYDNIQGGTDTEHMAALIITYLCPKKEDWENYHTVAEMKDALQKTINTIIEIQNKVLAKKDVEPNDLNVAITDGRSLVASRFRNHATEQPPSLYYSTSAGVTMNRRFPDHPDGAAGPDGKCKDGEQKSEGQEGWNSQSSKDREEHGGHVIIASEPTTYRKDEWNLIEKNKVVLVQGGTCVVENLSHPGA